MDSIELTAGAAGGVLNVGNEYSPPIYVGDYAPEKTIIFEGLVATEAVQIHASNAPTKPAVDTDGSVVATVSGVAGGAAFQSFNHVVRWVWLKKTTHASGSTKAFMEVGMWQR